MNDILRLVCIGVLLYSLLILWQRWEKWPPSDLPGVSASVPEFGDIAPGTRDEDSPPVPTQNLSAEEIATPTEKTSNSKIIVAETDRVVAAIDDGGNLVSLRLKNHKDTEGGYFAIFEDGRRQHGAQSGLIGGDALPDHRAFFTSLNPNASNLLSSGADLLTLALAADGGGTRLIKRYIFERDSDIIRLELEAHNIGNVSISPKGYFQLFHNGALSEQESSFLPSFFGAAVFTDVEKFQKIDYEDIGTESFPQKSADGWIGFIQRYFAAVWLPEGESEREYYMRAPSNGIARIGVIAPFGEIAPGTAKTVSMRLLAGAQEQDTLNILNEEKIAPGIHLVVDYGWLTFIAVPMFKLLSFIQTYAGNWGLSVILLTFLIKLLFYPLSSISYRSIARMKELSPRIKNLQEIHGGDKQKLQQAMMTLYREKKINPLGGCLPVLLQIPVFIALYWVILGSVELRHAPFYLWIEDLSASDPFFVLPLLMGGAMFMQTRMSPAPPDPTQAMIIKIMPLFFTAFSLFFPAGLVLYWLVNTLLSITQQWHIARTIRAKKGRD